MLPGVEVPVNAMECHCSPTMQTFFVGDGSVYVISLHYETVLNLLYHTMVRLNLFRGAVGIPLLYLLYDPV